MSGFISEELFYINHCHEAISQGPNSHLPPSHSLWRLQAVSNITPLPLSSLTWILKLPATLWSVAWRVVLSTMSQSLITTSRTSIKWRWPTPSLWTQGIKGYNVRVYLSEYTPRDPLKITLWYRILQWNTFWFTLNEWGTLNVQGNFLSPRCDFPLVSHPLGMWA